MARLSEQTEQANPEKQYRQSFLLCLKKTSLPKAKHSLNRRWVPHNAVIYLQALRHLPFTLYALP